MVSSDDAILQIIICKNKAVKKSAEVIHESEEVLEHPVHYELMSVLNKLMNVYL